MRLHLYPRATALVLALASVFAPPVARAGDVGRLQAIPLGLPVEDQAGERCYGVYVPTRHGGVLSIKTTAGKVVGVVGPEGRGRVNGEDVGKDAQGWYTFDVTGADRPYTVETRFVQVGRSARKPWNFYYWPTKADSIHEPWAGGNGRVDTWRILGDDIGLARPGDSIAPGEDIVLAGPNGLLETPVAPGDDSTWFPNEYDDLAFRGADGTWYATPAPMLKYDQIFGTSARIWEAAHSQNQEITRWPGHCLGGALASIFLNEPVPAPASGLTGDELKALWAELGENHRNQRIGASCTEIPPGPPRPGPDETDRFAPRVHNLLETHLLGKGQALLGNLRAYPPRGTTDEVWNHAIGEYSARYTAIPGRSEREVKVEVELTANSGSSLNARDDSPRVVRFVYALVYGFDGIVDESQASLCDWIGLGGEALYCPLNLLEILEPRWQGDNPSITESNLRALDLANGGNAGSFPGPPRQFQVVSSYEAGRAVRTAPGVAGGLAQGPPPRRGGLFRFLNRR
ncbi:MAG: hypothetical protein NVSMB9_32860 [Isosphaeraceae bacterium]